HQNLALHFEIGRFRCMKNPAFLLNLSLGSVRTVEDESKMGRYETRWWRLSFRCPSGFIGSAGLVRRGAARLWEVGAGDQYVRGNGPDQSARAGGLGFYRLLD